MSSPKTEKKPELNKEDAKEDVENFNGHQELDEEPKTKVARLELQTIDLTLRKDYLLDDFAKKLHERWFIESKEDFKDSATHAEIFTDPFQICLLPEFLQNKESCKLLLREMVEKVHWSRKQMDLYEFYQSTDLSNMIECKFLANFLQMMRRSVRPWLEKVTNLKLDYVSASCSMYTCGDYLLVHDDLLKDRQIAFIYYLSPWEKNEVWSSEKGGCLEIFSSDDKSLPQFPVKRKISPKNNQFAFFKVGSKSFHQVGEVTTFDYPRLTINGWFHGASNDDLIADVLRPFNKLQFRPPMDTSPDPIDNLLNEVYLKPTTKRSIQKRIEDNSEICLYEFFRRELFEEALKQLLTDNSLKWSRQGPANAQNYEVLDLNSCTKTILKIIKTFSNKQMFSLLRDFTDLDLYGPSSSKPTFSLEVQKWSHGDYTVLGDGAICEDNTLDLIYYLNASEGAAVITYLSPDSDQAHSSQKQSSSQSDTDSLEGEGFDDDDESVLLTITPMDNALNIVYRCEDKYRLYSTIAFMTVVIIIGVPMWWKTTEVFRVSLPSADIMNIDNTPLITKVKIGVFTFKPERTALLVQELKDKFENEGLWVMDFKSIPYFEKASTVKTPAGLEKLILQEHEIKEGDFVFIEWPKLQEEILLTNERTALIRSDTSSNKIKQVLNTYILQTHRVKQILAKDQRNAVKTEAPQAEYDIIVSVLNPKPEIMNARWHVQMAVETYLKPYLDQVSHISNYTLKTQWKFQIPFEANLRQVRDNSPLSRHYALSESSLPHIITSIEKNLGVGISDKTPINLVVYITPCDIAPVYIYNKQGQKSNLDNVNAFISPKWGGVIIANPSMEICREYNEKPHEKVSFFVQTNDIMQIMLYQLQKLLDINIEVTTEGVKTVAVEQLAPRRWEYEAYLRRSAITHITTATNTLQSLIKLLDNISYIVINDDVGKAVNSAYELVIRAKESLASHELMKASELAQKAFIASEQAFFDASLLAQLYFPDEQKYAIYIPLFLPIMVPVITSFSMMIKLLRKQREVKKKLKTT